MTPQLPEPASRLPFLLVRIQVRGWQFTPADLEQVILKPVGNV